MRSRYFVSRLCLGLLIVAPALGAQVSDTTLAPTATPQATGPLPEPNFPSAALARAGSWPHWKGAPLVFMTPTHALLVTTPLSAAWIAAHDEVEAALGKCRDFIPAVESGAIRDAWDTFNAAAGSAPLIMIQIMPAMRRNRPSCEGTGPPPLAIALRGIALQDRPTSDEYEYPRGALLRVGGRAVRPVLYGRVPVELLARRSRGSASDDTIPQLRLYIAAGELAPDSLGRLPRVTVRVWGRDTSSAVEVDLPGPIVHQIWDDLLPWRLQTASVVVRESTPTPLPIPSDSALRVAWRQYDAGDFRSAALLTHERFYAAPLTRDDSLEGRVQLAFALLAMGDTVDAEPVVDGLMNDNPCLTLSPAAPPEYGQLFDRVRPRARCDVAVGRTIASGLLLPGLGQLSRGRPFGVMFSAGSAIAITIAAIRYSSSQSEYRAYQSSPNSQSAVILYAKASRKRREARSVALTGIGIWIAAAVEAGISEMRHGAEVQRVRSYGLAPIARSDAGRTNVGLALTF